MNSAVAGETGTQGHEAPSRQGALLFCWQTNKKPDIDDEEA